MAKTHRRDFIASSVGLIGASLFGSNLARAEAAKPAAVSWANLASQWSLDPKKTHLSSFLLSSPPKFVQEEIFKYRQALDLNPAQFLRDNEKRLDEDVRTAAAKYLGTDANLLAIVESTTAGLGILYGGLSLKSSDEVLTSTTEHFSHREAIRLLSKRTGAKTIEVSFHDGGKPLAQDALVEALKKNIRPNTKILAGTWIHSESGLKIPAAAIGKLVSEVNKNRTPERRLLYILDGVHAMGIENFNVEQLGCDFFVAGCHKSLLGPRGTGILCGSSEAWSVTNALIPTFSEKESWAAWKNRKDPSGPSNALRIQPGGYHSFENRWALAAAFHFHLALGREKIEQHVHQLAESLKSEMRKNQNIVLHTPLEASASSGLICFTAKSKSPTQIVRELEDRSIIASVSPYKSGYARLAPGIMNSMNDVEKAAQALKEVIKP